MKDITEVYSDLIKYQQPANLGFRNLNNYFAGRGDELSLFFVPSSILDSVLKQINVLPVSSIEELGYTNSFCVCDNHSWKQLHVGDRMEVSRKFRAISSRNKKNGVSSTILIVDSTTKNTDNYYFFEIARVSTFIAEIISSELEMIIIKNRHSHKGKIQLNLENKNVLELLNYKTQKYNCIIGQSRGFKTTVMHSIIKSKLDQGNKVCYSSYPEDIQPLFLYLLGKKRSDDITPELLKELVSSYGNQLFLDPGIEEIIPEDYFFFLDSDFDLSMQRRPNVKSKEIWCTLSQNRNGGIDFNKIAKDLSLKENEYIEYLNVVVNNDHKLILETVDSGKGFWLDRNHRISPDLFVNMNDYESLLFLDKQVQSLTLKINNEFDENNLIKLNRQREELLYKMGEKIRKNSPSNKEKREE